MDEALSKCHKLKTKNITYSQLYQSLSIEYPDISRYANVSTRINQCGNFLLFQKNIDTQARRLYMANFCKTRFCPFCSHRKSEKNFVLLSETLKLAKTRHNGLRLLFVTLTVKNAFCTVEDLKKQIMRLLGGYRTFINKYLTRYCPAYLGSFRNLELTINETDNTIHPHIHCLIAVDSSYFAPNSKSYITKERLTEIWSKCIHEDLAINDIRALKGDETKSMLELSKYTVKDEDVLKFNSFEDSAALLNVLDRSLLGVRATAYTGLLRTCYREVKNSDPDPESDLFPELRTIYELFRWYGQEYRLERSGGQELIQNIIPTFSDILAD